MVERRRNQLNVILLHLHAVHNVFRKGNVVSVGYHDSLFLSGCAGAEKQLANIILLREEVVAVFLCRLRLFKKRIESNGPFDVRRSNNKPCAGGFCNAFNLRLCTTALKRNKNAADSLQSELKRKELYRLNSLGNNSVALFDAPCGKDGRKP